MANTGVATMYDKIKKLNVLCATLSGLILLFISFSIFTDVILRYFFGRPSTWVTEVTTYLFLYVIFLATAYTLQQDLHVRVTFLLDRFGPGVRRVINLVTSVLAMVFCFVLLWQTSVMTWTAFSQHWTSPTMLSVPYVYIYVAMVVGSLLLFVTFLLRTIVIFMGGESEAPE